MALDQETLTQTLTMIERFVQEKLMPLESEVERDDFVNDDVITEMKEMGLFGISIPEAYGGLGLTMSEEVQIAQRFSYTSPAFRSAFGTNVGIGSQGILMDGTEEQKQQYLPRVASGELIMSFALTEPNVGSDAGAVECKAIKDGDSYILNGTKRFITNAPRAGAFTLMARTGSSQDGARGVTAFIIDAQLKGISLGESERKMGQRGIHVCDVILDNVRVPQECIIGGPDMEGQGFKTAMRVLDRGRLHISGVAVGAMKRLIDESLSYATERVQFGKPIAQHQLIQAMLADSKTDYLAAKSLVESVALKMDAGEKIAMEASACKLFSSEAVGRVADKAVQIHGGSGYIADYAVERFYRDVRLLRLYEGTTQIQQIIIAKQMINNHDN